MSNRFEMFAVKVIERDNGLVVSYSLPSGEVIAETVFGMEAGEGFVAEYASVNLERRNKFVAEAEDALADSAVLQSLLEGFNGNADVSFESANCSFHVEATVDDRWSVRLYELDTSYPYDDKPVFVRQIVADWESAAGLAAYFRSLDIDADGYQ